MDHEIFRATCQTYNAHPCVYEKTLLTHHGNCSLAQRFCIAEREGVACAAESARADCSTWIETVRQQARFTLRSPRVEPGALPHAKALRIQVGGLRGLQAVLEPGRDVTAPIADIRALVTAALIRFGRLERLPFQPVIQQIAAFKGRPRRSRTTPSDRSSR